jgi:hypothetical protein
MYAFPLYHKGDWNSTIACLMRNPQNPMVPAPKLGQTMGHLGHFWLRGGNKLATNCTISYHQMDCPEDCVRCFRKVYVTNVLTRYHWMPHCQPFEIPCPEKCPKSFESPGRKKVTRNNMFFSEDRHFVRFHNFGILISFTEHLRTLHQRALRRRVDLLGDKPSNPQPLKPCQECPYLAPELFLGSHEPFFMCLRTQK